MSIFLYRRYTDIDVANIIMAVGQPFQSVKPTLQEVGIMNLWDLAKKYQPELRSEILSLEEEEDVNIHASSIEQIIDME